MSKRRENDTENIPLQAPGMRSSRGYEVNGQWYFELRGGGQKGPFESEEEMLAALNEFILLHEHMKKLED